MMTLKQWTEAELRALSKDNLLSLYVRCQELSDAPEANEALSLIEMIGIPRSNRGMTLDSPFGKKMQSIIFLPEAKAAAIESARNGFAPMAEIDPMLQERLGKEYRETYESTIAAGYLVANLMRQNQWEIDGKKRRQKLPPHCVAKTAALFVYIPSKKS